MLARSCVPEPLPVTHLHGIHSAVFAMLNTRKIHAKALRVIGVTLNWEIGIGIGCLATELNDPVITNLMYNIV